MRKSGPDCSEERNEAPPLSARGGRLGRWVQVGALAFAFVLLCGVLMFALLQQPASALASIEATVHSVKVVGVWVQICLVAWIGLRWHRIVAWGRRRGFVNRLEHRQVLALRPKVMAFLAAYLVLIPIGPGAIYRYFAAYIAG